jgi:hypothetical protein
MTIGNDDSIRAFLADEARRAMAAAPSLDEAVGRLAPRIGRRPMGGASQRLIVLLAATLLLAAALGTAIAAGTGILRLVIDDPKISGGMWPQSNLDEVREAQELAAAGDPRYTWQVDPELRSGSSQPTDGTEIVARFLREELGWEEFRLVGPAPDPDPGASLDNEYVRCAPGETNPLYPNDPRGSGCAPTMADGRYERVSLDLGQLVRQDNSGIWVVTRWEMIEPFEQVVPLSEAETTAYLDGFVKARIDGESAQEYLGVPDDDIPFLYVSSTGAPYVRSEFEIVEGPLWPDGPMRFTVRLFTDDGETVEQHLSLEHPDEGLLYESEAAGPEGPFPGTTVNGQVVPVPYSFLDGDVTLHAAYPWHDTWTGDPGPRPTLFLDEYRGSVVLVADPVPTGTGCLEGPAPADAQALARSILSDPDLEATAPVAVTVGGTPALRMDVVAATGASVCHPVAAPLVVSNTYLWGDRMRLYLLDLPGGSARILAIAIDAPEAHFERVLEAAAPIVDSIEFHAR